LIGKEDSEVELLRQLLKSSKELIEFLPVSFFREGEESSPVVAPIILLDQSNLVLYIS